MSDPANTQVLAGSGSVTVPQDPRRAAPSTQEPKVPAVKRLVGGVAAEAGEDRPNPLEYPVPEEPMETVAATNLAATEFYTVGIVPKFDTLRSRVMQLTRRNPSITTIHKAYKSWQANSMVNRFADSNNAIDKLPDQVRHTVNSNIDVIYAACMVEARKKFDGQRDECLLMVEQANETAAMALAEKESAQSQNTMMQEQINALQVNLGTAQELLGQTKADLDAEKRLHEQTRQSNVQERQELQSQMEVLSRSLTELEGTRKHLLLELDQLRDDRKRMQAEVARVTAAAEHERQQARAVQADLEATKRAAEELRAVNARMAGQKELITEQLADIQMKLTRVQGELAVSEDRFARQGEQLVDVQNKLLDTSSELQQAKASLDVAKTRLSRATARAARRRAARAKGAKTAIKTDKPGTKAKTKGI